MLLCTATGNGTTLTFIDTLNLNHEQSILVNRQGIFSGGTANNLARVVRVESNVKASQTLTFTPAVPSSTAIGDELELWNERDEGVTPAAVNDLINDAILDALEFSPTPITSDAFSFAYADNIIDIDTQVKVATVVDGTNWEVITGVDRRMGDDADFNWVKIDSADLEVDRYARTITIKGQNRALADTMQIRVRGANLPVILSTDAATTSLSFEWITHHVAAQCLGIRLEKAYNRKDIEGRLLQLQARADAIRPKTNLRLRGRFWRLS